MIEATAPVPQLEQRTLREALVTLAASFPPLSSELTTTPLGVAWNEIHQTLTLEVKNLGDVYYLQHIYTMLLEHTQKLREVERSIEGDKGLVTVLKANQLRHLDNFQNCLKRIMDATAAVLMTTPEYIRAEKMLKHTFREFGLSTDQVAQLDVIDPTQDDRLLPRDIIITRVLPVAAEIDDWVRDQRLSLKPTTVQTLPPPPLTKPAEVINPPRPGENGVVRRERMLPLYDQVRVQLTNPATLDKVQLHDFARLNTMQQQELSKMGERGRNFYRTAREQERNQTRNSRQALNSLLRMVNIHLAQVGVSDYRYLPPLRLERIMTMFSPHKADQSATDGIAALAEFARKQGWIGDSQVEKSGTSEAMSSMLEQAYRDLLDSGWKGTENQGPAYDLKWFFLANQDKFNQFFVGRQLQKRNRQIVDAKWDKLDTDLANWKQERKEKRRQLIQGLLKRLGIQDRAGQYIKFGP